MSHEFHQEVDRLSRRNFLGKAGAAALITGASGSLARQLLAERPQARTNDMRPLDPTKRIRIGVVGGGFGASFQWHLDPNCIVHAVSDLRPDRRKHLQGVYRCDLAYESLDLLIRDPKIDAVAVFTGAPDHFRHCTAAMEHGKHVICAVPACLKLEEAEALRDLKEKTGLAYMMAETSYYNPSAIAARELFAEGAFGELFYSEVEYNHPITDRERHEFWFHEGERTWRHGYAPMLYPTHATSYLTGTTGERLTEVSCLGVLAPPIEGYGIGENQYNNPFNAMMGLFKTNRKHICRANVIWTGTNAGERAQWFGTELSFFMPNSISGQELRLDGPGAPSWIELPDYHQRLPDRMQVESGHGGSHTFLTHEFVAALVEEREPAIDIYEALAMTVPGIVANQSAHRNGELMRIPSFDRS